MGPPGLPQAVSPLSSSPDRASAPPSPPHQLRMNPPLQTAPDPTSGTEASSVPGRASRALTSIIPDLMPLLIPPRIPPRVRQPQCESESSSRSTSELRSGFWDGTKRPRRLTTCRRWSGRSPLSRARPLRARCRASRGRHEPRPGRQPGCMFALVMNWVPSLFPESTFFSRCAWAARGRGLVARGVPTRAPAEPPGGPGYPRGPSPRAVSSPASRDSWPGRQPRAPSPTLGAPAPSSFSQPRRVQQPAQPWRPSPPGTPRSPRSPGSTHRWAPPHRGPAAPRCHRESGSGPGRSRGPGGCAARPQALLSAPPGPSPQTPAWHVPLPGTAAQSWAGRDPPLLTVRGQASLLFLAASPGRSVLLPQCSPSQHLLPARPLPAVAQPPTPWALSRPHGPAQTHPLEPTSGSRYHRLPRG